MGSSALEEELRLEYRAQVENDLLGDAIRNASLLFIALQTVVFVPADWILHQEHFWQFFTARFLENGVLLFVYFKYSYKNPVHATAFTAFTGSTLFLYMVHLTGGVESGYYVGLMLLLVGIAVLAPLSGKQSSVIAGSIFIAYSTLPWTSHGGVGVEWRAFAQHLFFLGSACMEAGLACLLMDRMRFKEFRQRRELVAARDELAEMDKAKSRFSANVHHELRTPLTLILSPLDALRAGEFGDVPDSICSTLDMMQSNGRRLHKMINNLLDLSKLESEQFSITRRPTRIDRMLKELFSGATPTARNKGVELVLTGFDDPIEIAVDPDAIEKVFVNLLGNALKFTGEGGRIEIEGSQAAGGLSVSVTDSGIGIPSDKLDSIFDRFAQVDSSATRSYEGTGIGLSLAKEMVELHAGRISAESKGPNTGTTLRVWLPSGMVDSAVEEDVLATDSGTRLSVSESIAALEADLKVEPGNDSSSIDYLGDVDRQVMRSNDMVNGHEARASSSPQVDGEELGEVLIVEDNPDMRQLLKVLVGRHYHVRTARNGREAIDRIQESKPDLVLSDVMMPEMDGTELCRAIKSDPDTASIPIILVTSKAESEMKVEGLELGANDYVTKPFHPRELLARVGSLVRTSVLRQQLALRNSQLSDALSNLQDAEVKLVQNEKLAAVGELAAGIAHEVNNPVNFAINAARMLVKSAGEVRSVASLQAAPGEPQDENQSGFSEELKALCEDIEELAGIVAQGLDRTHALVNDLKSLSSLDSKASSRISSNLENCISSAVNLTRPLASSREIEIETTVIGDPKLAEVNESMVGQVLLNLIKNACDATPDGGKVEVRLVPSESNIRIEVADHGEGISDEHAARLFEPFYTTKTSGTGTGLGLAICRQIMAQHGGTIDFVTQEGSGSTFFVDFPAAD